MYLGPLSPHIMPKSFKVTELEMGEFYRCRLSGKIGICVPVKSFNIDIKEIKTGFKYFNDATGEYDIVVGIEDYQLQEP